MFEFEQFGNQCKIKNVIFCQFRGILVGIKLSRAGRDPEMQINAEIFCCHFFVNFWS
jgi:hypothetical protein